MLGGLALMITYKRSNNHDILNIIDLFTICFGNRISDEVYKNINGRYLLAYDGTKLIAMTGINHDTIYNGAEVDWTCVHSDYRGQGIITSMLRGLLTDITEDVYCSCWHEHNNSRVNLHHAMETLGFNLVLEGNKRASYLTHKACKQCCKCMGTECQCSEDLYVRRYIYE